MHFKFGVREGVVLFAGSWSFTARDAHDSLCCTSCHCQVGAVSAVETAWATGAHPHAPGGRMFCQALQCRVRSGRVLSAAICEGNATLTLLQCWEHQLFLHAASGHAGQRSLGVLWQLHHFLWQCKAELQTPLDFSPPGMCLHQKDST